MKFKFFNLSRLSTRVFFVLCLMIPIGIFAQDVTVNGIVKDLSGEVIIGANVRVVGNETIGTITDIEGNFSLLVPKDSKQLEVSYIGMKTIFVDIVKGKILNVLLKEDLEQLEEVVVIGYQAVSRKDLTGSVSSVKGDDIVAIPVSNIAQAMQGKIPGVNISSQDGRPDASVSIRVRGGGSISQSNEPLILVDGITVSSLNDIPADQVESIDVLKDASSTAIYGARGANGVILVTTKGAKEGKISVTYNGYVKFNTPTKYLESLSPYDYLSYVWANTAAYGDAYRIPFEKLFGLGDNVGNNVGGIESYRNMPSDDIQRDVYNFSLSHNHDFTINGGTDKTKVMFSVNYMDEQGMKVNSYAKRANISLKVKQKLYDNLELSLDTRYNQTNTMSDEGTVNGAGSILSSAYRFRPIETENILGDLNALREGNIEQYGKQSLWDSYSPYNRAVDQEPLKLAQKIRGTLSLNWNIINNLTFHTDLTLSRNWSQDRIWNGAVYNNYLDDETNEKLWSGSVDYRKQDKWNLRWTNTLSYTKQFSEKHKLNILVGHEMTNSGGTDIRITANHFPANFTKDNAFAMINQYDQTAGTSSFSSGINMPDRVLSFFGRINYTLMDRYLFTATLRADGSSKFSPSHRWGYFPAAAFAWRISEEEFLTDVSWLNNLKMRISLGTVGNDGIDSNLWSQTWASETDCRWQYTQNQQYLPSYDLTSSQMANTDLKWETTITRGIGFDLGFLKNRLWGTVDLYWNTTKDLLMLTTLPGITGFTDTYANIGQTSNKGIEISLSGIIYKNKDWSITAGANINFNKGNVDKLAENITGLYGTKWASAGTFPAQDYILIEGKPVGQVRGLVYQGFYTTEDFEYMDGIYVLKDNIPDLSETVYMNAHGLGNRPQGQIAYPGLPKYKDKNSDGIIDEQDVDIIANTNPIHTGGFNLNINYKNFDLGAYFNWSYGNDIYNMNKLASSYGAKEAGVYENKLAFRANAYKIYDVCDGKLLHLTTPEQLDAANINASVPLAVNENGITSTYGIEDGSFLRLNTITLGYTFPNVLINKIGISNLRVYGSVYNLCTITGYSGLDPEVSTNTKQNNSVYPTTGLDWGSYPRARSFVVGININF